MHIIPYIGQIIFGGFFIWSGIGHFTNIRQTAAHTKSKGVPFATLSVVITGIVLIAGGLSILTGFYVWIAAWFLLAFMLIATFLFHSFWNASDKMDRITQTTSFAKNMAIIGALLMIMIR